MPSTSPDSIVYPNASDPPQAWTAIQNTADSVQTALTAMKTWNSWTPTFVTGPTGLGAGGTAAGHYTLIGDLCMAWFQIRLGTGPTVSGTFEINLPVPFYASWPHDYVALGSFIARDNSPTVYYEGTIVNVSPSSRAHFAVSSGTLGSSQRCSDTSPMTWAIDDALTGQLSYRTT